ncbi:hypothetical protein BUALT_Bualt01G0033400 [Buddleja alternifolia]|uniref:C2H2-type domain-containing protein n=1 Tax=Buddleja alternifolia TaxID=168488 RepID=A0AAV6YAT0_9LAMI|nr:hypothetical protein BUALT_Bualt01G0032500 [Buddleja alternifolia]KAG8389956.1 hypothetical protein BUALT_Bualt01G0033400 [Buddleja alternifolia]
MAEIENSSPASVLPVSGESKLADNQTKSDERAEAVPPTKKKRNLPGMPDPDAEVIALSPTTLLATNRFVCEICNKGFQREQNLQLHRRGHNLPWKLRQRTSNEVRKRVYVCPESTCIHHDPSRALGDLTGIKKHFCRKHGEKKYKCERCSKKYAVQSDWKAHMKTCGTREYRCDCGTLFSRRDSFVTHRAFCDALAQESERSSGGDLKVQVDAPPPAASSPPHPPLTPSTGVLSPVLSVQSSAAELPENKIANSQPPPPSTSSTNITATLTTAAAPTTACSSSTSVAHVPGSSRVFASIFSPSTSTELPQPSASYSAGPAFDPISLSLSSSLYASSSLFPISSSPAPQPALSATALLQKAAQMGATSSSASFLRGLGLSTSSASDAQDNASTMASSTTSTSQSHWTNSVKLESSSMAFGLGLGIGLPSSGMSEVMMCPLGLFGNKPATFDFLGLGMGGGETSSGGYSALLSSIGGGDGTGNASFAGVRSAGDTWDDPSESDRKPSML